MHIRLTDLIFNAHIGVFEQEQAVGARYRVNVDAELPPSSAFLADRLDCTVSYAELFVIVKHEMLKPCALLENTAMRILEKIHRSYPQILHVCVRITKLSPPIATMQGSAEIELSF